MSNVFLKNTTSSAITVVGYTVYYIDNTSAEIVEVEGTAGEPLPSIGDTVTFGNYPQATSTPEPIEWTVLDVDSVNGKAFLIAKKVLDGKTYGAYSDSTRWSNCSLREWLNSTFKTTAFDSSEQERIILSHIQNPSNSSTATPGGVDTDDYLFCLSIGEAKNTSYFSDNEARKCSVTQHAIDAGVNVSYGHSEWWLRSPGNYNIRAAHVYDSGGVNTSGDYVYETFGVRPAMWVSFSCALTFKYNAFKYTANGIPYWYVIDGTHNTWTDDLNVWGYTEVQPVVTLPTVTNRVCDSAASEGVTGWWPGNNTVYSSGTAIPYDESKSYSFQMYRSSSSTVWTFTTILSARSYNGNLSAYNTSSDVLTVRQASYAECSSNQAIEVQVYNSSNTAYNAFKYSLDNVDYYYVLDGVQTEWTNDLASIGYSLTPSVVLPTVSQSGNFGEYNWLATSINDVESISANSNTTNLGYNASTIFPNYDDTKSYGIVQWQVTGGETAGRVEFSIVNASGKFQAHNNTDSALSFYQAKVAACSSNQATVITVYNLSNVAYNAFKYTANNTDYYYVLDGTQTDWTDDLSSIGYHLISIAYLGAGNTNVQWNGWTWLYLNQNGSQSVPFSADMSYTFDSAYLGDGTRVNLTSHTITMGRPNASYTHLGLLDTYSGFTAYKIYYHAVSTVS